MSPPSRLRWLIGAVSTVLVLVAAVLLARPSTGVPDAGPAGAAATSSPASSSPAVAGPSARDSPTGSRSPRGVEPRPQRQPQVAVDRRGCGWFVAYEPSVMTSLDAGLEGSTLSPAQRDVLHGAVSGDTGELRSGLLAGGVPDIVLPGFGYTPLTAAVASRCGEAVRMLLAAGARPALAPPGS